MTQLRRTARALVSGGRGILAADQSIATLSAELEHAGVRACAEHRRAYRQLLVTTPDLHCGISGVILSDETFGQRLDNGVPFPHAVSELGMLPGIRLDVGARPLAGAPGETVTEGLDHLRERVLDYTGRGARFATWRALIAIGAGRPTERALRANAHALARYAAVCQEIGVVPLVEPRVLTVGDHTIRTCAHVTSMTLLMVMRELHDAGVDPSGVVLAPNLVQPGASSGQTATPDQVAGQTVRSLELVVSSTLAGVAVCVGGAGQTPHTPQWAAENLAALHRQDAPWPVTFHCGGPLTNRALATWRGDPERVGNGQRVLARQVNGLYAARLGAATSGRPTVRGAAPDDQE
ncbi:MAG: class I fructose-bisphosphate aldolase [Pseudonocardiaceae bacterium]